MSLLNLIFGVVAAIAAVAVVIAIIEITIEIIESTLNKLASNNIQLTDSDTQAISIDIDRLSRETGTNQRRSLGVKKQYGRVNLLVDVNGKTLAGEVIESDKNNVNEEVLIFDL